MHESGRGVKVHVTRPIPQEAMERLLREDWDTSVPDHEPPPERDALLDAVAGANGILSILTERIDARVMDRCPHLKVISNMAVGFDNVEVEEATRRGIAVCNTPGVLTETTADFAWALLMAVARRVVECDRFVREGRFEWWGPRLMMGTDVFGKTLGIVGPGKIGRATARRAAGFGMEILCCGGRAQEAPGRKVDLEELLRRSDFVSLHVPYSEATHHMLDVGEFAMMKPTAFLINTSRGAVVDESALVEALREGCLAGAGLDVFEREPRVHEALLSMKNVVLAPHAASASVETRGKMACMAVANLIAVLKGEPPLSVVNPQVLK